MHTSLRWILSLSDFREMAGAPFGDGIYCEVRNPRVVAGGDHVVRDGID